jgi:hypothetical protein
LIEFKLKKGRSYTLMDLTSLVTSLKGTPITGFSRSHNRKYLDLLKLVTTVVLTLRFSLMTATRLKKLLRSISQEERRKWLRDRKEFLNVGLRYLETCLN